MVFYNLDNNQKCLLFFCFKKATLGQRKSVKSQNLYMSEDMGTLNNKTQDFPTFYIEYLICILSRTKVVNHTLVLAMLYTLQIKDYPSALNASEKAAALGKYMYCRSINVSDPLNLCKFSGKVKGR